MKSLIFLTAILFFLLGGSACTKEEKGPPPLRAATLGPGRAAIRFISDKAFNGSKSFDVVSTPNTTARSSPFANGVVSIDLETTEINNATPTRKAIIKMLVRTTSFQPIDLSRQTGIPLGTIELESYSIFGIFRKSKSGTITITRITTNEVEGMFTATMDDEMNIQNGLFAARF